MWCGLLSCEMHFVPITHGVLLVLSSVRSLSCLVCVGVQDLVHCEQGHFGSVENVQDPLICLGSLSGLARFFSDCPIISFKSAKRVQV
jgi:hypothetical protein